ncbi:MAG: hypothetical protein K8E24_001265 [Methanobacterium paludis]|nr:hypothetical protein [Methanobacterium paludis]
MDVPLTDRQDRDDELNIAHKDLKSSHNREQNFNHSVPKVLLVGYNGANNTGSEARLISIIKDVRAVLGPNVCITIPTLNEKNLRRYIKEEANLKIVPIPSIFFFALRKLVKEHDRSMWIYIF